MLFASSVIYSNLYHLIGLCKGPIDATSTEKFLTLPMHLLRITTIKDTTCNCHFVYTVLEVHLQGL